MSFPRYPKYKASGVEWLGDVPEHWDVKRLKNGVQLLTEKIERRENPIGLENIESWSGRFVPTDSEFEGDGIAFESGDILFGKLRPYLAKVYLAESRGEAVGDFHVLRPAAGLHSRFAQYQLLNGDFIAIVDGSTFGSKMPRASWEFVGGMQLGFPPRSEQPAIAAFLDRETAKIDGLVAEQRRLIELLKEKRQAVVSHAVTKGLKPEVPMKPSGIDWLGDIPSEWSVMRIKRLVQPTRRITYGIVQPGEPDPSGRYMIRGKDYSEGWCEPEDIFRVSDEIETPYTRSRMQESDLVMTIVGAGVGNVAVIPSWLDGANITQTTARIAVDTSRLLPEYACSALQGIVGQRNLERYVYGSAQPRLNIEHVDAYLMTVPPLAEQDSIVRFLKRRLEGLDKLTVEAERAIDLLQERRTALISAAVTGKIDVREEV